MGAIKIVRLREEIDLVAEIVADKNSIRIIRPLVSRLYPPEVDPETGKPKGGAFPRLSLQNYLPVYMAQDSFDLDWDQVRFVAEPVEELREKYLAMMGQIPEEKQAEDAAQKAVEAVTVAPDSAAPEVKLQEVAAPVAEPAPLAPAGNPTQAEG